MRKDTVRITVAIGREVYDKLDMLCSAYGLTKSNLVAYYIGQRVDAELRVQNMMHPNALDKLMKSMVDSGDLTEAVLTDGSTYTSPAEALDSLRKAHVKGGGQRPL